MEEVAAGVNVKRRGVGHALFLERRQLGRGLPGLWVGPVR